VTEANRRWWTLAGTCMGLFVLMLDSTVINLALTPIAHDIGATTAGLQWVVNGYLLVLAATVVTAGRVGDILGRRAVFFAGMALFAAGSIVCVTSSGEEVLVGGRLVQGLGAAPLLGLSLAIVSAAFSAEERTKALGIWAGVAGALFQHVLVNDTAAHEPVRTAYTSALLGGELGPRRAVRHRHGADVGVRARRAAGSAPASPAPALLGANRFTDASALSATSRQPLSMDRSARGPGS
jgi:MFS family permease